VFSVLIPVYNEEAIIEANTNRLMEYLDKLDQPYEILICNNGSTDKTAIIGCRLESENPERVRFFSLAEKGVGRAFKKMVSESNSNLLISIDADLTSELSFIDEALKRLEGSDIAIGSKHVGSQKRSVGRKLLSGGFILLVKLLLGMGYTDYSIGTKAYKKSVIEKWTENIDYGSSYVIELIYYAKAAGRSIAEVPVFCDDRRRSRFNLAEEVFYRFRNLLRLWYRARLRGQV